MKFKYKKIILMVTMCTMFIGMVVFSILTPAEDSGKKTEKEAKTTASPQPSPEETEDVIQETEVSPDDIVLVKDMEKEVSAIVEKYLTDSVNVDMDALEQDVTNISMVDEKSLKLKFKDVEAIENVVCYMVKGPLDDGYLVYTYHDLKIKGIDTLAPGLSRFYVTKDENGEYKVYFGASTGLEEFIESADSSPAVIQLKNDTDNKLTQARKSDKKLDAFVKGLSSPENSKSEDSKDNTNN